MNNDVKYDEYFSRCLTIFNTDDNDDEVKLNEYCSRCLNNIQYWVCPRIDFWDPPPSQNSTIFDNNDDDVKYDEYCSRCSTVVRAFS